MAGQETCLVAGAQQVAKPAVNQLWSQSPVKEENHRKNRKTTNTKGNRKTTNTKKNIPNHQHH